ncbi:MAG: ankyrin repeat domain-containing protein [Blastocatellia bacterium]
MKQPLLCLILCGLSLAAAAQTANLNEELLTAARKSDLAAVKALLARGVDVNAKSPYGATPLFFACDRGSLEIVKALVESGADVNVKDTFYNSTAIGWAVSKNHIAIVKLLLEKGANSKQTVMRSAINEEKPEIVKMLLELGGFKPEEMTDYLTLAERSKRVEIAEIFKKAGAQPKPKVEYRVEPERLKLYEGRFKGELFEMAVKIKDGKLTCSIEQGFESALDPVKEHAFDVEQTGGVIVTFSVEENKVTGLSWKSASREIVLKKMESK